MLRTIGAARAKVGVTLMNLAYNLSRVEMLIRTKAFGFERVSAPKCEQWHEGRGKTPPKGPS